MNDNSNTSDDQPTNRDQRSRLWRWLGLKSRPGKRISVGLTAWGLALVLLVGFGVGAVGFMEYSMEPEFCRSCHLMEPYFLAWHESTHKEVPCADCHFEPGLEGTLRGKFEASAQVAKFITGTYGSKPHAEVRDASCQRSGCHESRLLEGSVEWPVQSQTGRTVTILFDHTPHLEQLRRGKELRCVSCHSQMVQGQHIVVTTDTCFLCHFKNLEHGRDEEALGGCDSCHHAPKEEIRTAVGMFNHGDYLGRGVACENCHSDSIEGDGAVPQQFCWSCHNRPQDIARYGETTFMHDTHVTENKVECNSCHVEIEHHLTAAVPGGRLAEGAGHMLENDGRCGQCHEGTHSAALDVYRGSGARGVSDMPSPMFRAQVDCIACHRYTEQSGAVAEMSGQTFVTQQASCDYCHQNQYPDRLEQWYDTVDQHLAEAEAVYAQALAAFEMADLEPRPRLEARRALDDADYNIRLIRHGRGVHNVNYATATLNFARDRATQALQLIESDPTLGKASP